MPVTPKFNGIGGLKNPPVHQRTHKKLVTLPKEAWDALRAVGHYIPNPDFNLSIYLSKINFRVLLSAFSTKAKEQLCLMLLRELIGISELVCATIWNIGIENPDVKEFTLATKLFGKYASILAVEEAEAEEKNIVTKAHKAKDTVTSVTVDQG